MRLTAFTNYALRVLMYAELNSGTLSNTQDIADAYGISKAHIVKCVHLLGQWGYLHNVRGRNGGFRLAKPASDITVGEIVRRTEEGLDLVECFVPVTNTCPLIEVCILSKTFKNALQGFLDVLDDVTVADLTAIPNELRPRLKLDNRATVS